jgi:hypothetical protein
MDMAEKRGHEYKSLGYLFVRLILDASRIGSFDRYGLVSDWGETRDIYKQKVIEKVNVKDGRNLRFSVRMNIIRHL